MPNNGTQQQQQAELCCETGDTLCSIRGVTENSLFCFVFVWYSLSLNAMKSEKLFFWWHYWDGHGCWLVGNIMTFGERLFLLFCFYLNQLQANAKWNFGIATLKLNEFFGKFIDILEILTEWHTRALNSFTLWFVLKLFGSFFVKFGINQELVWNTRNTRNYLNVLINIMEFWSVILSFGK